MPFSWVRPADPRLLDARPLLDLGCGDGQTLLQLAPEGSVGLDRSTAALSSARRSGLRALVCGLADRLPFADDAFEVVLAADLFHHLDPDRLRQTMGEIARVGKRLVAWWYEQPGRPAPDAPAHPRSYEEVASVAGAAGMQTHPLGLVTTLEPAPPTTGISAVRS